MSLSAFARSLCSTSTGSSPVLRATSSFSSTLAGSARSIESLSNSVSVNLSASAASFGVLSLFRTERSSGEAPSKDVGSGGSAALAAASCSFFTASISSCVSGTTSAGGAASRTLSLAADLLASLPTAPSGAINPV